RDFLVNTYAVGVVHGAYVGNDTFRVTARFFYAGLANYLGQILLVQSWQRQVSVHGVLHAAPDHAQGEDGSGGTDEAHPAWTRPRGLAQLLNHAVLQTDVGADASEDAFHELIHLADFGLGLGAIRAAIEMAFDPAALLHRHGAGDIGVQVFLYPR